MGTDYNISCKTCKVDYYLGYGGEKSKAMYEVRFPYHDHLGHDITETYSTDYLKTREDGHLWSDLEGISYTPMEYKDSIFLEDFIQYKFISFQPSFNKEQTNKETYLRIYLAVEGSPWLAYRIIQGDPSLSEMYKHFKDFNTWK